MLPRMKRRALPSLRVLVVCGLMIAGHAWAQEFRGSITGRVLDPSGAGVPAAEVAVTNTETGVATPTTTDTSGGYTVLYLNPGQYRITVTAPRFKKLERSGIEVRVGDKLAVDLTLEVGAVTQEVTVTGAAPLLETTTGSHGQVIDSHRLEELPIQDGNPTLLTRLAPGVINTGGFGPFVRAFDNGGMSQIVVNGAPGANEYTLNGIPNTGISRTIGFSPPTDAVEEFKVQNDSYDAQTGHTGGAITNMVLKSGTRDLHGSAYEFVRNDIFNANDFFRNRIGLPVAAVRYNRFGGSVGGPVILPRVYNGREKTFFFFAYENLRDSLPEPNVFTVPTAKQRNGDLSEIAGATIYDPFTGAASGGQVVRQPLCIRAPDGSCTPGTNNMINPARISPIAKAYLQFIPLPNLPGVQNNYIASPPDSDRFDSEVIRVDHNFSGNQRGFLHVVRNRRNELRGDWGTAVNGVHVNGQSFYRNNDGVQLGDTWTISPTTLLDVRLGFSRFLELSLPRSQGQFDPASMGFSPETLALFQGYKYLPMLTISSYLAPPGYFGGAISKGTGGPSTFNIWSLQPTITKVASSHTLQFGYDGRIYGLNASGAGQATGYYNFDASYTTASTTAGPQFGQSLAAFLLGLPTFSYIDRNSPGMSYQSLYHALFFQDNIKVSPRLSVNLGLRYELETPYTERHNRNVRGFDFSTPNPIEAQAAAAYTAHPDVLSPSAFHVPGGYLFADGSHRDIWNSDHGNLAPRVSFAYRFGDKTVLRGGWGVFVIPFLMDNTNGGMGYAMNQTGFSLPTASIPSTDGGVTFQPNNCKLNCWADPFWFGVATPPGSSLGLKTFLGQSISTVVPLERDHGLVQHWSVDIQRELPGGWLLDAGYYATRGSRLNVARQADPVPRQFLSTSPVRDNATINYLGAYVANPFAGLAPGSTLDFPIVPRSQLLRPFPQFQGIGTEAYIGTSNYQSGQVRVERRFSRGFTLLGGYTWSKLLERTAFLNETDPQPEKRISPADVPHQVAISGIYELPLGRGKRWGGSWPRALDAVAGGWQLGGVYRVQAGFPLGDLGNRYFNGDVSALQTNIGSQTLNHTFDTNGFYFADAAVQANGAVDPAKQRADSRIRLGSNIRTLPTRLAGFRGTALNNWDASLTKKFTLTERVRMDFRAQAFNLFNHVLFGDPNLDPTNPAFGTVSSARNAPRFLELGLKLIF